MTTLLMAIKIQGDDEASMATHRRLTPRGTALAPAQDEEGYYVHLGWAEKVARRFALIQVSFLSLILQAICYEVPGADTPTSYCWFRPLLPPFPWAGVLNVPACLAIYCRRYSTKSLIPSLYCTTWTCCRSRCFADKNSDRVLGMKLVRDDMTAEASANSMPMVAWLPSQRSRYKPSGASESYLRVYVLKADAHNYTTNVFSNSTAVPWVLQCSRSFLHGNAVRERVFL